MKKLEEERKRGFSLMMEMYAPGMSAMDGLVLRRGGEEAGVITIAGPLQRLTAARMQELGRPLVQAAGELTTAGTVRRSFATARRARPDKGENEDGTLGRLRTNAFVIQFDRSLV